MKYKVLFVLVLMFSAHCFNLYRKSKLTVPEVKTYEIKDKITGSIHIFYKEPKLKKSILYCLKDKENKVVWVDWHVNKVPEYTYRVDSYKNYAERNWIEQHYGYRIAP